MKSETKEFGEIIKEQITKETQPLEIAIKFPKDVYSKLKKYSKEKANNCFWLAIERLIENEERFGYDENKFKMLMDRDEYILGKVLSMEDEITSLKKNKDEEVINPKEKKEKKAHFG